MRHREINYKGSIWFMTSIIQQVLILKYVGKKTMQSDTETRTGWKLKMNRPPDSFSIYAQIQRYKVKYSLHIRIKYTYASKGFMQIFLQTTFKMKKTYLWYFIRS